MSAPRAQRPPRVPRLRFAPLTPEGWGDLESLFGSRGACGGCWCMWWRRPKAEFERGKGEVNRRALRALVRRGDPTGLLAYAGDVPVAWCSIAPRADFPRLEASRILAPVDDAAVWSIVCLFVAHEWRGRGVSVRLLRAAAAHARRHGARLVEGYPVESRGRQPDAFVWTGLASAFTRAGFREVARRSGTRPIMRYPARRR